MTQTTDVPAATALEPQRCIEMYRQMVLIRHFEELALRLRLEDRIHGVVHPYSGQEAIAVGVCANLRVTDRIVSNHRGHGHCIAKGADVKRMMAELFGRRTGYCKGKGGSMHIADFDVGMLGANGIVGAGFDMPGHVVDGNDVLAVYATTHTAVSRARAGGGPTRGLLKSAIRDDNPVVCFEPSRADPLEEDVADGDGLVPIGVASIKRAG